MPDREDSSYLFLRNENGVFVLTTEKPGEGKDSIEAFNRVAHDFSKSASFKERNSGLRFKTLRQSGEIGIVLNSHPDQVNITVGGAMFESGTGRWYFAVALTPDYNTALQQQRERITGETLVVIDKLMDEFAKHKKQGVILMSHDEFAAFLAAEMAMGGTERERSD